MKYKNILLEKNYLNTEEAFKVLSMTLDQVNRHYSSGGVHIALNDVEDIKFEKILIRPPHMVRKFNKFLKKNDFERDIKYILILADINGANKTFIRFDRIGYDLWSYEILFFII